MRKVLLPLGVVLLGLIALTVVIPPGSRATGIRAIPPTPAGAPVRPPMPTVPPRPAFSVLDAGNPNVGYGFTMALLGDNSRAASLGFQHVMYTLGWDTANPSRGVYQWGDADNIANAAAATGQRVLLRVMLTPAWARLAACSGSNTCPPGDPSDFGTFMGALAAHLYSYHLFDYEIWNEPNVSDNWGGLTPDPVGYVGLLRAAYPQVKAADPGALVVGPAVTTVGDLPPNAPYSAMGDLAYLNGIYDAGGAPYFDVLSDHPYGFGDAPEVDPRTPGHPLVFRRVELHREIMVAHGDAAKPIWATEMGWAMDPALAGHPECPRPDWYFIWSPQQQADFLVRAFQWARSRWSWMGAMFVFNYDFNQAPWYPHPCFVFDWFSVYGNPAESALYSQTHYPPPTYTPLPTATPTPVDGPPQLVSITFNQPAFNRNGGTVTLDVVAADEDDTPIDSVQAVLTYPDNSTQLFYLTLVAGTPQYGTWHMEQTLPPNSSGADEVYQFVITAIEAYPPRRTAVSDTYQIPVTPWRFWDVPGSFWAYPFVEWMANNGYVSGYANGSFHPNSSTTRAQLTKMLVLAEGWPPDNPPDPTFADVPPTQPFYSFIETAYAHGIISGYACGGPNEPCDPLNRPYFRPNNTVTRGQLSKMISSAEGWPPGNPPSPTFADVGVSNPFYGFVEAAYGHGIISGYACGGPNEPCDPQNRPYFRPYNSATRAQLSKMIYTAVQNRPTPTPTPTITAVPSETPVATATALPTATDTPTAEPTVTTAATETPLPTATDIPTAEPTVTVTATPAQGAPSGKGKRAP